MNRPKATLINPVAIERRRFIHADREPASWSADAIATVITIMPAMVPTPKTSKYAIAQRGL